MVDVNSINQYFSNLITSTMETERKPLYSLQSEQTTLNSTRSVWAEVSSKLGSLRDAVQSLMSTDTSYSMTAGRSVAVSNVASGFTVLSASVSSSAALGTYDISNIVLGKEQRVSSKQVVASDLGLGLSGTILLGGGAASRSTSAGTSSLGTTVSGFSSADPSSGKAELGSGTYTIQTRLSGSTYQFRVTDQYANAISVQSGSSGTFTSDWQDIPAGQNYDSGRGLKINFAAAGAFQEGYAQVAYTSKGVSLSITGTDSLSSIAAKINSATFPTGEGVTAAVVDRKLILAGTSAGVNIRASDSSGTVLHDLEILADTPLEGGGTSTGFKTVLQAADTSTSFSINGLPVTRTKNSGLSDVISGVTINLAPDAAGKSATITVGPSWTNARSAIDAFVLKFNEVQSFIDAKTSVTKVEDGEKPTYTRGPLADDSSISDLRTSLFNAFYSQASSGTYKLLSEIGITINDSLQISVSDSTKLENALNNNLDGVKTLMDQVMGRLDTTLANYVGSGDNKGYVGNMLTSIDSQLKDIGTDITDLTARLADRSNALTDQYAALQAQLLEMSYAQQSWSAIYSSFSTSG